MTRLTPRDISVLLFLWRWKMATTTAIAKRFFLSTDVTVTYNRLHQLKSRGYLRYQAISQGADGFAWTLTKRGFEAIQSHLPALMSDTFQSETPAHDFFVSAVHLGEWLKHAPPDVEFATEQELRSVVAPSWVPRNEMHRPDGYWRVPYKGRKVAIALEVELTLKRKDRYALTATFYRDEPSIERVVWIVRTQGMAKSISTALHRQAPENSPRHNFIIEHDIRTLGWGALIRCGRETGATLAALLGCPMEKGMDRPWTSMTQALLDTRKLPGRPRASVSSRNRSASDRVALPPLLNPTEVISCSNP